MDDIFFEIHHGNSQEAPGADDVTGQAFRMIEGLPNKPEILDFGCGPGRQTRALARLTEGHITALDNHQPFLARLRADSIADAASPISVLDFDFITIQPGLRCAGKSTPEVSSTVRSTSFVGTAIGVRLTFACFTPG